MVEFRKRTAVLGALLGLALTTASERAQACTFPANQTLQVGNGNGGEAPSGISDVSVVLDRDGSSGCGSGTTCGDPGSFTVQFTLATDPDSARGAVGYRLEVISGEPPGYSVDEYEGRVLVPSIEGRTGTLFFHWDDADAPDVDFTITLTPVDADGNEGPVSDPIRIQGDGAGCSIGTRRLSRGGLAAALTVLAGTIFVVRRLSRQRTRVSRA